MAVTDLTGTKWRINSVTCTAGYGDFGTEIILNDTPFMLNEGNIYIGYTWDRREQDVVPMANRVIIYNAIMSLNQGDIIEFTGGADVTNANLISFMQAHAEQIIEPSANVYVGELPLNSVYIGTDEIKKIYVGESLVYEA